MTAPLHTDSQVTIAPSVYARPFGSELVLLDFGKGEYFGLDELGAEVWRGIEAGKSLGAIASSIVEHYDVEEAEALRDIVELVTHMQGKGLVL